MKALFCPQLFHLSLLVLLLGGLPSSHLLCCKLCSQQPLRVLPLEVLGGEVWVSPNLEQLAKATRRVTVKVWLREQFLGSGDSYRKRTREFSESGRLLMRKRVVATLQEISRQSFDRLKGPLEQLVADGKVSGVEKHWIVNGFSCTTTVENIDALKGLPGVKRIFVARPPFVRSNFSDPPATGQLRKFRPEKYDPARYPHPWYIRSLLADRVWKDLGVTGRGTLNVVHDFNFHFPENLVANVYRNPDEIAGNGRDDDGNGLVDDVHGFNFQRGTAQLFLSEKQTPQMLHGTSCANIICGTGTPNRSYEFGIAPEGRWAGVIAGARLEAAVEWAILQGADTYSMSFSIPNLGELRSHWRKVMEQGSFCGLFFVSGAGNFAQSARVPVQMRTPEDIPEVVFAAAGVQRDLSRTPFSSRGPVEWKTEHYRDGRVQKPEVCAFNMGLPLLLPDGSLRPAALNGNSFAGPMFCGAIALMLSADPDLLPWDLKEIITSTATDVGAPGFDGETGHGLINCYRAVREVLRRKAVREGKGSAQYAGRQEGDELNVKKLQKSLENRVVFVASVQPQGKAAAAGVKLGDQVWSIDGKRVESVSRLVELVRGSGSERVEFEFLRGEAKVLIELPSQNSGIRFGQRFLAPVFE